MVDARISIPIHTTGSSGDTAVLKKISPGGSSVIADSFSPSKGGAAGKFSQFTMAHSAVASSPNKASAGGLSSPAGTLPPRMMGPWNEMVQAAQAQRELKKAITPELQAALEKALTAMQAKGVKFTRDKNRLFDSPTRIKLSPGRVIEHLRKCRSHHLDNIYINVPGYEEFRPEGIGQFCAAGQFVLGPNDALKNSLKGLADAGFDKSQLASYSQALGSGHLTIQFYRGGQQSRYTDNLETYCTTNVDEVLAVNAFAGNGSLDGVKHKNRIKHLNIAINQGWMERDGARWAYKDPLEKLPLKVDKELPPMLAEETALDDLPATAKAMADYQKAYRQYLLPVITARGFGKSAEFHPEVHSLEGKLPIEARLESFAILAAPKGPYKDVQELHSKLVASCPSAIEATRWATALAPFLQKDDMEGAKKTLASLEDMPRDPRVQLYEELRESTGSHPVAQAGVKLVRIPTYCEGSGVESIDERKSVYTRLALALPEEVREQTPGVYQDLLIHRHADEPLALAGSRFSSLITSCTIAGCPMLAPALYEIMQEGSEFDVDERLAEFGKALAMGMPLTGALDRLDGVAASTIQVEDDRVVIGGLVLPRQQRLIRPG